MLYTYIKIVLISFFDEYLYQRENTLYRNLDLIINIMLIMHNLIN